MSKSLKRVRAHLATLGLEVEVVEMPQSTRSAEEAARAADCAVDQIVKSIVFKGLDSDQPYLFLTAGGRQVQSDTLPALTGEALGKADAAFIRAETGFAIGGVSPFGHLKPVRVFMDRTLMGFPVLWAAAGTPRHVFRITPADLLAHTDAMLADFT